MLISLLALVGGTRGLGDVLGLEGTRCVSLGAIRKKLGYTIIKLPRYKCPPITVNKNRAKI